MRQLWEVQPEENCLSTQRSWEARRFHGWHGAPEFQYYSRLVGFRRDKCWASKILLWLIAATLKAKLWQKKRVSGCFCKVQGISRRPHSQQTVIAKVQTSLWFTHKISRGFIFQNRHFPAPLCSRHDFENERFMFFFFTHAVETGNYLKDSWQTWSMHISARKTSWWHLAISKYCIFPIYCID